jgi:ATP-dependent Clp protease protease subunit
MSAELALASFGSLMTDGIDLSGRRIFLHGGVDEDTIGKAIRAMYFLADLDPQAPIELFVSSYGGDLDEAFALHDVTRTISCPIHTVALGKCMSAAPMLAACGQPGERYATRHTSFMLHAISLHGMEGSTVEQIRDTAKETQQSVDDYVSLLVEYSNKPRSHWARIFKKSSDTYFDAETALEWGLIDGIWNEKS